MSNGTDILSGNGNFPMADRKELIKARHRMLRAAARFAQQVAEEVLQDEEIELNGADEMGEFPQS